MSGPESQESYTRQSYGKTIISGPANVHQGNVIQNYTIINRSEYDRELFNQLCYYSMNARRDQIVEAEEDTCEWIWDTSFTEWLSLLPSTLFWIRGKPGSGKSTLMKYLSRSSRLRQSLPHMPTSWVILDFFFDFRQSDQVANSYDGLMRTMLNQMFSTNPRLEALVHELFPQGDRTSTATLQKMLTTTFERAPGQYLVLIDGLDEYEGNMQELLRSVRKWQRLQNLKLCLASRPEPIILGMLDGSPTVNMASHNRVGIQRYVQNAISDCRPHLDELKLPKLMEILVEKSQGLFLWVYLAVREIADACFMGATASEIEQILLVLPKDLEPFYQRIIHKVPDDRKTEAAMLFSLVSAARQPPPLKRLFCAVNFLVHERDIDALHGVVTLDHFDRRMNATMGGLVETVPRSIVNESISDATLRAMADTEIEDEETFLPELTYQRASLSHIHVRTLHETVRTFSRNTAWFESSLPEPFITVLPDRHWVRLCFKLLRTAASRTQASASMLFPLLQDARNTSNTVWTNIAKEINLPWAASVVHFSKVFVRYLMQYLVEADNDLRRDMHFVMRSKFAELHFLHHVGTDTASIIPKYGLHNQYGGFILAAAHHYWDYFYENEELLSRMTDDLRNELVATLLLCCPKILSPCPCVSPRRSANFSSSVRKVVDLILCKNRGIAEDHLFVYMLCRYRSMPQFLRNQGSETFGDRLPKLADVAHPQFKILIAERTLTGIWLSQSHILDGHSCHLVDQVSVLRRFGVRLEDDCTAFVMAFRESSGSITGKLCDKGYTLRVVQALYLFEALGIKFHGEDILSDECDRLAKMPLTVPHSQLFRGIVSSFEHKVRYGHLHSAWNENFLISSHTTPDASALDNIATRACWKCKSGIGAIPPKQSETSPDHALTTDYQIMLHLFQKAADRDAISQDDIVVSKDVVSEHWRLL